MIDYTGRHVFRGDKPDEGIEAPSLAAIAIGLGRLPRFAGQTRHLYTVLDHTLVVAKLVLEQNRLHALLHDAPEAVVGDVPTTWKTDQAREAEWTLLFRIYSEHGWAMPDDAAVADVKRADSLALKAEAHIIGHPDPMYFGAPTGEYLERRAFELTRHALRFAGGRVYSPEAACQLYLAAINDAAPRQLDAAA